MLAIGTATTTQLLVVYKNKTESQLSPYTTPLPLAFGLLFIYPRNSGLDASRFPITVA